MTLDHCLLSSVKLLGAFRINRQFRKKDARCGMFAERTMEAEKMVGQCYGLLVY